MFFHKLTLAQKRDQHSLYSRITLGSRMFCLRVVNKKKKKSSKTNAQAFLWNEYLHYLLISLSRNVGGGGVSKISHTPNIFCYLCLLICLMSVCLVRFLLEYINCDLADPQQRIDIFKLSMIDSISHVPATSFIFLYA